MSYLTGFFLVFAGMLIGYFLWYRDRTEEDRNLHALDREADDLRRGLKLTQQSKIEIEERLVRQRGQLSVLQQLCEDWSSSREQSERERAQLSVELEDKRKQHDELTAEVQRLKKIQMDMEDRWHQQSRQNLESANQSEQSWQKKYLALEMSLNQHQSELKQAERDKKRLSEELHRAEKHGAELKTEIATNKKLLETATRNVSGLKQEYVSLESSLKEHHDQLKRSRGETAAALSEKKLAQQSLADLQAQYQQMLRETDDLRKQLGSVDSLRTEAATLHQALQSNQQQLEALTHQRDQALLSEKRTLAMAAGLQTRLNNQESTIHKLREAHRESMEKLKYELQLRGDLEATYDEHCKTLEARLLEKQKHAELQTSESNGKLVQQVEQLRRQLAQQATEAKSLSSKNDSLSQELDQNKAALSKVKADLQTINHEAAKLKAETLRMANLEKSLTEHDARLKREIELSQKANQSVETLQRELQDRSQALKKETQTREAAETQIADLKSELARRAQRIAELESRLETAAKDLQVAVESIADLKLGFANRGVQASESTSGIHDGSSVKLMEQRLKASEETIRQLRKERAGVLARLANYRTVAESEVTILPFSRALEAQRKSAYDHEYGGAVRHDSIRGVVYTEEPAHRDDLKLISGIAEVLEGKLNDQGIYTFKQIRDWTPEAVEEFGRLFHFKDRITREDWPGQARKLYQARLKHSRRAA